MSTQSKKVSDAVKPVLISGLSAQAYAALLTVAGFGWIFGLPIICNVTQYVINRISSWAVEESAAGMSILWIMLSMQYEVSNAEEGARLLKDMINNPGKYTQKEADEIEKDFDDDTVDLIQLSIDRL